MDFLIGDTQDMDSMQWVKSSSKLYEKIKNTKETSEFEPYLTTLTNIFLSDNADGICNICQLMSRCLKFGKDESHPERFIGINSIHTHENSSGDMHIFNNMLCQRLWTLFPSISSKALQKNYVIYFFLCTLSDTLKHELSHQRKHQKIHDFENVSNQESITSIHDKILIVLGICNNCMRNCLKYSPAVLRIIQIVKTILKHEIFQMITSDISSIKSSRNIFYDLSQFTQQLQIIITDAIDTHKSQKDQSYITSSHMNCNFIDPDQQKSLISTTFMILTLILQKSLSAISSHEAQVEVEVGCAGIEVSEEWHHVVESCMDQLLRLCDGISVREVLMTVSENDSDLIDSLHNLTDIHINLTKLSSRSNPRILVAIKSIASTSHSNSTQSLIEGLESPRQLSSYKICDKSIPINKSTIIPIDYITGIAKRLHQSNLDPAYIFISFVFDCICEDVAVFMDLLCGSETKCLHYFTLITRLLQQQPSMILQACQTFAVAQIHRVVGTVDMLKKIKSHRNSSSVGTGSTLKSVIWVTGEVSLEGKLPSMDTLKCLGGELQACTERVLHEEWNEDEDDIEDEGDGDGVNNGDNLHKDGSSVENADDIMDDGLDVVEGFGLFLSELSSAITEYWRKDMFPCNPSLLCNRLDDISLYCSSLCED